MMHKFEYDKRWSDKYITAIKCIVGPHLLAPSSLDVDRNEAADLVVLRAKNLTIACRVRRPSYKSYRDEFTLRSRRPTGVTTELEKIVLGWGDWFLYGHAAESGAELAYWKLIDLNAFRAHLILNHGQIKSGEILNPDGTAFRWYSIPSFPKTPSLVIACSEVAAMAS